MVKRDELTSDLFWMVFVEVLPASRPSKKHFWRPDAIKEAKRLSIKHPDHKVYILETIGYCTVEKTPVNFMDFEVQGKPHALGEPLHQGGFS